MQRGKYTICTGIGQDTGDRVRIHLHVTITHHNFSHDLCPPVIPTILTVQFSRAQLCDKYPGFTCDHVQSSAHLELCMSPVSTLPVDSCPCLTMLIHCSALPFRCKTVMPCTSHLASGFQKQSQPVCWSVKSAAGFASHVLWGGPS